MYVVDLVLVMSLRNYVNTLILLSIILILIFIHRKYQRRFQELLYFIERFNDEYHKYIQVIEDPYNHSEWVSHFYPLKDLPEGSIRCRLCYSIRMRRAFDYANMHHFDYWTTVLSVSPHKNTSNGVDRG